MKFLPAEDMKAYLDEADRRHILPMFYLELVSGLRKGELVALLCSDRGISLSGLLAAYHFHVGLDIAFAVSKQATRDADGNIVITRPKTETSVRLVSIPQRAVELLQQEEVPAVFGLLTCFHMTLSIKFPIFSAACSCFWRVAWV